MRLLILSDIHSNIDALDACLAAAGGHDSVANLGDVVGYGGAPNEVVERVRDLAEICVRGNHDRACSGLTDTTGFNPIAGAAARWTFEKLTEANRQWVHDLPRGPIIDANWSGLQFVHGSPFDEDEYVMSDPIAEMIIAESPFDLTFFGHTHLPAIYALRGPEMLDVQLEKGNRDEIGVQKVELEVGTRYLINPGSIGQPRDGDPRAKFAVYDSGENSVTFYRVPYDIAMAQHRIIGAGLPMRLAARLSEGR